MLKIRENTVVDRLCFVSVVTNALWHTCSSSLWWNEIFEKDKRMHTVSSYFHIDFYRLKAIFWLLKQIESRINVFMVGHSSFVGCWQPEKNCHLLIRFVRINRNSCFVQTLLINHYKWFTKINQTLAPFEKY